MTDCPSFARLFSNSQKSVLLTRKSLPAGKGFFRRRDAENTECTEETRTRMNADERGFCWSRKVGEWIARAFAAIFA